MPSYSNPVKSSCFFGEFMRRFNSLVLLVFALFARTSFADIVITLNVTSGLTSSQQAVLTTAKSFWESTLTGYKPGISITGPTITASGTAIDGAGGVLGSAGPTGAVFQGGYFLTTAGQMQFDTADLAVLETNGQLQSVFFHEMAHVLGFGTLWTLNGAYVDGSGQFTGANALNQYKSEFNQPAATFVPVELGGGESTANSHWKEVEGGTANTGIVDGHNRDFKFELMTGWLNSPTFVSNTTIASFEDIGFTSNLSAVPEPSSIALFAISIIVLRGFWSGKRGRSSEG